MTLPKPGRVPNFESYGPPRVGASPGPGFLKMLRDIQSMTSRPCPVCGVPFDDRDVERHLTEASDEVHVLYRVMEE